MLFRLEDVSRGYGAHEVLRGLTLQVNMTAPAGGTSAGASTLSTTAVDVVTGITQLAQSGIAIGYTLDATPAAGVIASTSRTVTYTITGGV